MVQVCSRSRGSSCLCLRANRRFVYNSDLDSQMGWCPFWSPFKPTQQRVRSIKKDTHPLPGRFNQKEKKPPTSETRLGAQLFIMSCECKWLTVNSPLQTYMRSAQNPLTVDSANMLTKAYDCLNRPNYHTMTHISQGSRSN